MPTATSTSTSTTCAQADCHSAKAHTSVADNVHVKSVVSHETQSKVCMENAAKITQLMTKLGSTHSQVDDYSRKRTEEISETTRLAIQKIVAETQIQQEQLLNDAHHRSEEIEHDYKLKLEQYLKELDNTKAKTLAVLEKDLSLRQETILELARKRIDDVNEEANRLKMHVLKESQLASTAKIEKITGEVAALSEQDAARRLQSTTTTVITTHAKSEGGVSSTVEIK